jgi:hypothetical protein
MIERAFIVDVLRLLRFSEMKCIVELNVEFYIPLMLVMLEQFCAEEKMVFIHLI